MQIDEDMEGLLGDFGMGGDAVVIDAEPEAAATAENGENDAHVEEEDAVPVRVPYTDYLKSPIVELVIGEGEDQTRLNAHQGLLVSSPFFEDICSRFEDDTTVRDTFASGIFGYPVTDCYTDKTNQYVQ